MKRLIAYLVLMGVGVCQADVPKLFTEKNFNSTTLAEAVNHFVAIGQTATVKELQELAHQKNANNASFFGQGFSVDERIGWVCRILFIPQGSDSLRPPQYGYLSLPEKFMPATEWPLYPIAQSGSTYIVLGENYTTRHTPEKPEHYIAYCVKHGTFRKDPVAVPTKEQALKDTLAFRASDRWKHIKWEDENGVSYPMGEQFAWAFFQNQARLIPDAPKPVMVAKERPQPTPAASIILARTAPVVVKPSPAATSSSA